MINGLFKDQIDYIKTIKTDLSNDKVAELFKIIHNKRTYMQLVGGSTYKIQEALEKYRIAGYKDDTEAIKEWTSLIEDLHKQRLEINRGELLSSASVLDLVNDDYSLIMCLDDILNEEAIEHIVSVYNQTYELKRTSTGF
jgi:hypothetical protein